MLHFKRRSILCRTVAGNPGSGSKSYAIIQVQVRSADRIVGTVDQRVWKRFFHGDRRLSGDSMIDLAHYRDRLSEKAQELIAYAIEESQRRQHYYLGVEHLFLSVVKVENQFYKEVMYELGVDPNAVVSLLKEALSVSKQYLGGGMKIPTATRNLLQASWGRAQNTGRQLISTTDIFAAIFMVDDSVPVEIMRQLGVDPQATLDEITILARRREEREREMKKRYELPPYINQFAVNLNKLAAEDKVPEIFGRDEELDRIIEILSHRERSNSAMIIGEPGVGKTALVEGLARRIEYKPETVPYRLRESQIINLQMNALVAGTMFRGMFEDRVEKIIKELRERKNLIVFVDEAHSLIGAGSAMGVPSDAANIFKSSLARGEIQMIGATTNTEYKQFIQEDEALSRRFRTVVADEPDIEQTRHILLGIRPRLERNYSVTVSDEAINMALEMSRRYNRGLRLPDKAIGWLDTASVKVEIANPMGTVGANEILQVVSEESKIPLDMVFRDTNERFLALESELGKRVIGQREAIEAVSRRLRLNKGPLKENFDRPDGVLLFLGPTGVGKTELGKAVAEFLYGDDKKMVRIDMSEYKDSSVGIDKLIGMPRGIVGSERGGLLTNAMRENPSTVVLLDEIEKANPNIINLFLQVFDEGWVTDGRGKKVYFSDSIIIMTSNLGAQEFKKFAKPMGFLNEKRQLQELHAAISKEVESHFTPEFINRIDEVVIFDPLTEDEVLQIARIYLQKIEETVREKGKEIEITDEATRFLATAGYNFQYGARFLKRRIDELVKIPMTLQWNETDAFKVDVVKDELTVEKRNRVMV